MENKKFVGFNLKIKDFFINLENNNNKEWFDQNRTFYEIEIREPLKSFTKIMQSKFYDEGLNFVSDPKISLFRINRDIRFSKNKSPYKTNLGIFFPFTLEQTNFNKKPETIGLYVHWDNSNSFIAGGLHSPKPLDLRNIRNFLLYNYKELDKILNNKALKKNFPIFTMNEHLSNIPRGFPKNHPADNYLKLNDFTLAYQFLNDEFFSDKLDKIIIDKAKVITPFCDFLLRAVYS